MLQAGRRTFARLWAHNARTHTVCWHWHIHMGSQKYGRRNEKTTLFILSWPGHSHRQPPHVTFGLQVGLSFFVTSWWRFFCFFSSPLLIYLFLSSRNWECILWGKEDGLCGWQETKELGGTLTNVKKKKEKAKQESQTAVCTCSSGGCLGPVQSLLLFIAKTDVKADFMGLCTNSLYNQPVFLCCWWDFMHRPEICQLWS